MKSFDHIRQVGLIKSEIIGMQISIEILYEKLKDVKNLGTIKRGKYLGVGTTEPDIIKYQV